MGNSVDPSLPPTGWYPDPTDADQLRYWNGSAWTGDVAPMAGARPAELTATRRNATGDDVLYIELTDGTNVGRVKLGTGKVVIERPELHDEFYRAVAVWEMEQGQRQLAEPAIERSSPPLVSGSQWRDLAANRPGEALRRRAIEVRQEAPLKAFFGRVFGMKTDERAWRIGADGEEEVARRLARLGDRWKVIHGIVLNDSGTDIDHVAIGPGGVYTLNTKNHLRCTVTVYDRMILVNGQKTSYLPKSRAEGSRASRRLSVACGFPVDVEPVVVVMCREFKVKGQPEDVHVVGRRDILRWLQHRPVVLGAEDVDRIYEVARRESTWRR